MVEVVGSLKVEVLRPEVVVVMMEVVVEMVGEGVLWDSKSACGEVRGVEKISSTGSKLMDRGEECFEVVEKHLEMVEEPFGNRLEVIEFGMENIEYVVLGGDLLNRDVPFLDIVTKEVMTDFNMFGTGVENEIFVRSMAPLLLQRTGISSRTML
ncbi:hypothetical protein Tco_0963487 [Tanacetum coccineum]